MSIQQIQSELLNKNEALKDYYTKLTEKLLFQFEDIITAVEQRKNQILAEINEGFNRQTEEVEKWIKDLTDHQKQMSTFTEEISQNWDNIIQKMEQDAFTIILSNYDKKIDEFIAYNVSVNGALCESCNLKYLEDLQSNTIAAIDQLLPSLKVSRAEPKQPLQQLRQLDSQK